MTRDSRDSTADIDRRSFLQGLVAVGGQNALAAASQYGRSSAPSSRIGASARENRQHAWHDYSPTDERRGLPRPPNHHVLLFLQYRKDGRPTPADREATERSFRNLERAFDWSADGLLFLVGYSRQYFDRFDETLPPGVQLPPLPELVEQLTDPTEDPASIEPEPYDAVIHLASDRAANVLAAEEGLFGEVEEWHGVEFEHTLDGVFERPVSYPARRTGVVGSDSLDEAIDSINGDEVDTVTEPPDGAPTLMGSLTGFASSQATEGQVTLYDGQTHDGPAPPRGLAGGTLLHTSTIRIDLAEWYDINTDGDRIAKLFSEHHDVNETGRFANELAGDTAAESLPLRSPDVDAYDIQDIAELTQSDAENRRLVGHAQKIARARTYLYDPDTGDQSHTSPILRRDVDTLDGADPGVHFLALTRFTDYFAAVREAMNSIAFDGHEISDVDGIDHEGTFHLGNRHGILNYLDTQRRGAFLVPPLTARALPRPRALDLELLSATPGTSTGVKIPDSIDTTAGVVAADAPALSDPVADIDTESFRIGPAATINRGGGENPQFCVPEPRTQRLLLGLPVSERDEKLVVAAQTTDGRRLRGTWTPRL